MKKARVFERNFSRWSWGCWGVSWEALGFPGKPSLVASTSPKKEKRQNPGARGGRPAKKIKTEAAGSSQDSASGLLREILALAIENETLRKLISNADWKVHRAKLEVRSSPRAKSQAGLKKQLLNGRRF